LYDIHFKKTSIKKSRRLGDFFGKNKLRENILGSG